MSDSAPPGAELKPAAERGGHLVALAPGWDLWRSICLRGTGFPVSRLDPFGSPDVATAVDALFVAETAKEKACRSAFEACKEARLKADPGARTVWNRAARLLAKGRVPDPVPETAAVAELLERAAETAENAAAAGEAAEAAISAAQAVESAALAKAIAEPRFREALTWQNRKAYHDAILPLAESPGSRNRRTHDRERLVLRYLQRYTVRNESIGFFGPVGWGQFADSGPAAVLTCGPRLVAERVVEFEPWALRDVAAVFSREPKLLPFLAPRINPFLRFEGDTLCDGAGQRHRLAPPVRRLFACCDGATLARDVAARLMRDPGSGFADENQVFTALAQLARRRALIWRLDLPPGRKTERLAAAALARIGDDALRARLTGKLGELVAARDRLAETHGDPAALDSAFADLESSFARITGGTRRRNGEHRSVGRAVAYEDCRRDVELSLGPEIPARLGPPLSLMLASARWFTEAGTKRAMSAVADLYVALRRETGNTAVDFTALWSRAIQGGLLSESQFRPVLAELQSRWTRVLPLDSAERRVALDAASLAPRVARVFRPESMPYAVPVHHSPDVMIAAKSAEAIRCGDYRFVLGEIHAGYATQMNAIFFALHPRPEELIAAWRHDTAPCPLVFPTLTHPERRLRFLPSVPGFELACNEGRPSRPWDRVLAISDLVAEQSAAGLMVRTRDGARAFHVLDMFAVALCGWSSPGFKPFPAFPHTPRITIDDLVVKRETWTLPCVVGAFFKDKSGSRRFVETRRLARAHGFPRRVFVRFPQETKPVYIDLESPAFVDLMAHLWRAALRDQPEGKVSIVEMLPGPEEAWLVDAQGNRYTSELRIVAVEAKPR